VHHNDTANPETYPLSLHDALPISTIIDGCIKIDKDAVASAHKKLGNHLRVRAARTKEADERARLEQLASAATLVEMFGDETPLRSEEHTSELQSLTNLVCRLLLEK